MGRSQNPSWVASDWSGLSAATRKSISNRQPFKRRLATFLAVLITRLRAAHVVVPVVRVLITINDSPANRQRFAGFRQTVRHVHTKGRTASAMPKL